MMRLHEWIHNWRNEVKELFEYDNYGYAFIPRFVNYQFTYKSHSETGYYKFNIIECCRISKEEYEEIKNKVGYQMELFK